MTTVTEQLLFGKVLTPHGLIEDGVIAISEGTIRYAGEKKDLP